MLFNSANFLFLFLPLCFAFYWAAQYSNRPLLARMLLLVAALLFYGYWNWHYVPVLMASVLFNAMFAWGITSSLRRKRLVLLLGIVCNMLLLIHFKYTNFIIENINMLFGTTWPGMPKFLPLGISFFTFTQVAYLIDIYRVSGKRYSLLDYSLFVTYFPHLPAGPIIHHGQMLPQFHAQSRWRINYENISKGFYLLVIGLFKKVILADTLAFWVNNGYKLSYFDLVTAWIVSIAYSFQLYFDFSGYSDMAIGISLLLNINLPINFNSPYKALNIQDFWRRWHITLSHFLRDYVYIPLGGNRGPQWRTLVNVLLTFLIGGIWHGAGWNFLFWGLLHGVGLVSQRLFGQFFPRLPRMVAWPLTFGYVNLAWVFFRAPSWGEAIQIVKGLFGFSGILESQDLQALRTLAVQALNAGSAWSGLARQAWHMLAVQTASISPLVGLVLLAFFPVVFWASNSTERAERLETSFSAALLAAGLLAVTLCVMLSANDSQFLYFEF